MQEQDTPARTATYPVAHAASEALGAGQARVSHAALPALRTRTQHVSTHREPGGGPSPTRLAHLGSLGADLTHLETADTRGSGGALRAQSPLKDRECESSSASPAGAGQTQELVPSHLAQLLGKEVGGILGGSWGSQRSGMPSGPVRQSDLARGTDADVFLILVYGGAERRGASTTPPRPQVGAPSAGWMLGLCFLSTEVSRTGQLEPGHHRVPAFTGSAPSCTQNATAAHTEKGAPRLWLQAHPHPRLHSPDSPLSPCGQPRHAPRAHQRLPTLGEGDRGCQRSPCTLGLGVKAADTHRDTGLS